VTGSGSLAEALAAEHAAIYAYGPIGVRLDGEHAATAREAEDAHRHRRDALVVLMAGRGTDPPTAAVTYELPFEVTNPDAALRLAVLVEERVAAVWRAALPETTAPDREVALDALVDAAVRATRWRLAAGVAPATVPFPGAL
jgi:hypothetical protein